MSILTPLRGLLLACAVVTTPVMAAEPLQLDVYNPGEAALFPVSSVIVSGAHDAILVDAQFGKSQAEQVVERLRASGKRLTTIYISHGDPDYYFGLDTLTDAFPDAAVVASAATVAHIRETKDAKLAYWGPKMGDDQPARLIVPQVLSGDRLQLEGKALEIVGLNGPQPDRSVVWIPSIKAVVGGVVVSENIHVWMADTQSAKSHADWLQTLATIENLNPRTVIPGHYLGQGSRSLEAVRFTAGYIRAFDEEAAKAKNAEALVEAMTRRYPTLAEKSSLELGAKVAKGEMKWSVSRAQSTATIRVHLQPFDPTWSTTMARREFPGFEAVSAMIPADGGGYHAAIAVKALNAGGAPRFHRLEEAQVFTSAVAADEAASARLAVLQAVNEDGELLW